MITFRRRVGAETAFALGALALGIIGVAGIATIVTFARPQLPPPTAVETPRAEVKRDHVPEPPGRQRVLFYF